MIALILLMLAAICNAGMDALVHHFDVSIFSKCKNRDWFDPTSSWLNKYVNRDVSKGMRKTFFGLMNVPVAFTDCWHMLKSSMIVLMCLAIVCYHPTMVTLFKSQLLNGLVDLVIYGTAWNLTFGVFYNEIFKK